MKIHRAKKDQTVYDIAAEHGVNPIRLALDNEIESPRRLAEGRELLILTPTRTYTVKRGDTLEKIGTRFRVHTDTLRMQNPELYESTRLYPGQVITVKSSAVTLGIGIANGYLYPGYTRERLIRCMPYLSYLTVCCAVVQDGKISMLFDDSEALELAQIHKKITLIRIYTPDGTDLYSDNLLESAMILAKSRGYAGITLCESALHRESCQNELLAFKKQLIDRELILVTEQNIDAPACPEIADMSVLCYDKIQLDDIPSFKDGEEKSMISFAERCSAESAFIDISPFAMINGKFKQKTEAYALADRYKSTLEYNGESKTLIGTVGRGKRCVLLKAESLENTKAKLELVAELGYLGISFDIMRAYLADLLMFSGMFDRPPTIVRRVVCNPKD